MQPPSATKCSEGNLEKSCFYKHNKIIFPFIKLPDIDFPGIKNLSEIH